MKNTFKSIIVLPALLCSVSLGQVAVLDFNIDDQGNAIVAGNGSAGSGYDIVALQPYQDIYGPGSGVNITSSTNLVTVYDTNNLAGQDIDLSPSYVGGNNPSNLSFGNAIILQTNDQGAAANNIDIPNDDGQGGILTIASDLALNFFSFNFLDLDNPAGSDLIITDSATGQSAVIPFADFESGSGSAFDSGADFGDRHSNLVNTISVANLQTINPSITSFDTIVFDTAGSGGAGNFILAVPEPSTTALFGLGALGLLTRRRR